MSHQHDGSCGCSSTDPLDHDRNYADSIRGYAQGFLTKEGLPIARAMLHAARTLLANRGGVIGEKAVWLIVAEAHLPALEGNFAQSLTENQSGLALSEKELGPDHLATGVCVNNVADTLMELNRPKEAKPLYERAQKIFKKCSADLKDSDAFLSKFADDAAAEALKGWQLAHDRLGE